MESETSGLLPHILETLSEKPEFCDTFENLCNEIKIVLSANKVQHQEIEENIESALNVGQDLGILTWTNDLVRMPFNYNKTAKRPTAAKMRAAKTASITSKGTYDMPGSTYDMPAIRKAGHRRKRLGNRRSRRVVSRRKVGRISRRRSQSRRR